MEYPTGRLSHQYSTLFLRVVTLFLIILWSEFQRRTRCVKIGCLEGCVCRGVVCRGCVRDKGPRAGVGVYVNKAKTGAARPSLPPCSRSSLHRHRTSHVCATSSLSVYAPLYCDMIQNDTLCYCLPLCCILYSYTEVHCLVLTKEAGLYKPAQTFLLGSSYVTGICCAVIKTVCLIYVEK